MVVQGDRIGRFPRATFESHLARLIVPAVQSVNGLLVDTQVFQENLFRADRGNPDGG